MQVTATSVLQENSNLTQLLESHRTLEDIPTIEPSGQNLTLGYKLKAMNFIDKYNSIYKANKIWKIKEKRVLNDEKLCIPLV